jgi:L-seryl-tRNA(Ser) seleniumtransferase
MTVFDKTELLRQLPSVDLVLRESGVEGLITGYGRDMTVSAVRSIIDNTRRLLAEGGISEDCAQELISINGIVDRVRTMLIRQASPTLKQVINGTGVIIHTNLGRAPLYANAAKAAADMACGYMNLEYNLDQGTRGWRHDAVKQLLCSITGAEDGLVVNNNAAAVLLTLSALARGREVVISRGQLVEIGGSFRVPEVMEQGGAKLIEVGTTNKTRIDDYERAIGENTALLLKVHTSNYKICGFTGDVPLAELVKLAKKHGLPVVEDLGSGVLIDLKKIGLSHEPTVQQSIAAGADVVTFSGDKLLGGPQAGIIVGRQEYIKRIAKHPLARAVRVDKLTLTALEYTLREYLDPERAIERIPVLNMLSLSTEQLMKRAERLIGLLSGIDRYCRLSIERGYSQVGGGSLPLEQIDTVLVCIDPFEISVNDLDQRLRHSDRPVVGRISKDHYIIDMRTIFEEQIVLLAERLKSVLSGEEG